MNDNNSRPITVMVFGTFDGLHDGHRYFLRSAKSQGDRLIVLVSRDNIVKKLKGSLPRQPLPERVDALHGENIADVIAPGDREIKNWASLKKFRPDIICAGYDQYQLLEALQKEIPKLDWPIKLMMGSGYRTDELHSSILRRPK